jgi:hypothetical protein
MRARTFVCCSLSLLSTAVGVRRNKTHQVVCPFFVVVVSVPRILRCTPYPQRGKGKAAWEKKTVAQFRLWGQLAAKVSSGKDNRARRERELLLNKSMGGQLETLVF